MDKRRTQRNIFAKRYLRAQIYFAVLPHVSILIVAENCILALVVTELAAMSAVLTPHGSTQKKTKNKKRKQRWITIQATQVRKIRDTQKIKYFPELFGWQTHRPFGEQSPTSLITPTCEFSAGCNAVGAHKRCKASHSNSITSRGIVMTCESSPKQKSVFGRDRWHAPLPACFVSLRIFYFLKYFGNILKVSATDIRDSAHHPASLSLNYLLPLLPLHPLRNDHLVTLQSFGLFLALALSPRSLEVSS